jgi:hypothetical protein
MPVCIRTESEALKPWRTKAYLKYVGVRQDAGNEAIWLKANRHYASEKDLSLPALIG